MPVTLLNAPVLTTCGTFCMQPVTLAYARSLVGEHGFTSAIGHQASADCMSQLLNINCTLQRWEYRQALGDQALVLRLKSRLPEGVTLYSLAEIERVGYSLNLLVRIT